jgi:hypothetical protein
MLHVAKGKGLIRTRADSTDVREYDNYKQIKSSLTSMTSEKHENLQPMYLNTYNW